MVSLVVDMAAILDSCSGGRLNEIVCIKNFRFMTWG